MADEIIEPSGGEPTLELNADEQKALDRARGENQESTYVQDNFNADGTPIESFKMPEKFEGKTAEDIAKAYMELEKLKEKQANSDTLEGVEGTKEVSETNESPETTDSPTELLTPDQFTKYEQAYVNEGGLSEEHYKELEGRGLSKQIVDNYIEGLKLKGETHARSIYEVAGGQEQYQELVNWAKENYTETQAKRFDEDIKSGNLEYAKEAVETLKLRMGTPPRRIDGQGAGDGGLKAFQNKSEHFEAVRNPAYGKDKAYTAMVDKRYIAGRNKGLF